MTLKKFALWLGEQVNDPKTNISAPRLLLYMEDRNENLLNHLRVLTANLIFSPIWTRLLSPLEPYQVYMEKMLPSKPSSTSDHGKKILYNLR